MNKDKLKEFIDNIDESDDYLLYKKTEVESHYIGNCSDRGAYQLIRCLLKDRPEVLSEIKEKLL